MNLKDSAVRLYVKGFIIPRALIFDKPGFVDFKISGKTEIFARQLIFPESFFVKFEKRLMEEFDGIAESLLYSLGKRFGYSFAQLGQFENIKSHPGERIKNWIVIATKFVEGTYASNISQTIEVDENLVEYALTNFVICRKLENDPFFATGGAAGIIAWIFQNPNIEGHLYNSKFTNDEHTCNVKCAPKDTLKRSFDTVYSETSVHDLSQDPTQYREFNRQTEIQWNKSFQTFLDAKIFRYEKGIISYEDERFFLFEASGMYILENGITDENMKQILFESAYSVGAELFTNIGKNDILSIMELLSALGWGEVSIQPASKKTKVIITHFPWTKYYRDIEYIIVRGLLSGILSHIQGRDIQLGRPAIDINSGHLSLIFESR